MPALRFGDLRVHAMLACLLILNLLPMGFANRQLRQLAAPLLGLEADEYRPSHATYDLRRLRMRGLIERIPNTNHDRVTETGQRIVLCYCRCSATEPLESTTESWESPAPLAASPRPMKMVPRTRLMGPKTAVVRSRKRPTMVPAQPTRYALAQRVQGGVNCDLPPARIATRPQLRVPRGHQESTEMVEVPKVSDGDFTSLKHNPCHVTGLNVELDEDRPVITVTVEYTDYSRGSMNNVRDVGLALSPPAAARLSRLLAERVQEYLDPNVR